MSAKSRIKEFWSDTLEKGRSVYTGYFEDIRFAIIPLAFVYLGLVFLLLLVFQGAARSLTSFSTSFNEIMMKYGQAVTFNAPALGTNYNFFTLVFGFGLMLTQFVSSMNLPAEASAEVAQLISRTYSSFIGYPVVGIGITLGLTYASTFVCAFQIRKAHKIVYSMKQIVIGFLLYAILTGALGFGIGWLLGIIPLVGTVLAAVMVPVIKSLLALYRAFLKIAGLKNFKQVFAFVTGWDVLVFFGLNLSLFGFFILVTFFVLGALKDAGIAIMVGSPFFVYTSRYIEVHSEMYILNKAKKKGLVLAYNAPIVPILEKEGE